MHSTYVFCMILAIITDISPNSINRFVFIMSQGVFCKVGSNSYTLVTLKTHYYS